MIEIRRTETELCLQCIDCEYEACAADFTSTLQLFRQYHPECPNGRGDCENCGEFKTKRQDSVCAACHIMEARGL